MRIKTITLFTLALLLSFWTKGQETVEVLEYITDNDIYTGKADIFASEEVRLTPGFRAYKGSDVWVHIKDGASYNRIVHTPGSEGTIGTSSGNSDRNWVHTISMREPISDDTSINSKKRMETYDYYDGLGRFDQKVIVQGSPGMKDIVQAVGYDDFGRKEFDYLPFEGTSNTGAYVTDAPTKCVTFYSGNNIAGRTGDDIPMTQTVYEPSPLNRVDKTYGPGENWQSNPTDIEYLTNSSVTHWDEAGTPFSYSANELYVTQYTDEDGNISREFKDKLGQMVRKENDILDDAGQPKTIRTAYVYDDFGLLRTVVPPLAGSPGDVELCYFYTYDERKRMVSKDLPGAGVVYMVYDERDRLVMTQDANMRAQGKWLATIYDQLNRPVMTALVDGENYETIEPKFDGFVGNASFLSSSANYAYDVDNVFPSDAEITFLKIEIQTVTYYDNYNFLDFTEYNQSAYSYVSPHLANNPTSSSSLTKSLVTGVFTRVLETNMGIADTELLSVSYYDDLGRVIRTVADNHLGGKDMNYTDYNFAGQPEENVLVHQVGSSPEVKMTTNYTYDHQGRLLHETVKMDDLTPVTVAANTYNEIGELLTKYLHGSETGDNFNQKVDYAYNIRGWLLGMNEPGNLNKDLFAMGLAYDAPDQVNKLTADPTYNGNISQMFWHTAQAPVKEGEEAEPDDPQKGYGFKYDKLNRLREANYADGSSYNGSVGGYNTSYKYDDNGNITYLERNREGSNIDALDYTYVDASNQLESVEDHATGDKSDGYQATTGNYSYDPNGNMDFDISKSFDIDYNYLNMPNKIVSTVMGEINNAYNAVGTKLRKEVSTSGVESSIIDYSGPFVYENNALKSIFTSEGRIAVFEEETSGGEKDVLYKFEYNLKDHLENVRLVFGGHTGGKTEYIQRTDYYPFGLVMAQKNYTSYEELTSDHSPFENKYLYNGKEWQNEEIGGAKLDWYDYGARMYDAQLGRWHVIDTKAENFFDWTPYNYALNNPLSFVDIDGEAAQNPQKKIKQGYTTTNLNSQIIQSTLRQAQAQALIKKMATIILLENYKSQTGTQFSDFQYIEIHQRLVNRIDVDLDKRKVEFKLTIKESSQDNELAERFKSENFMDHYDLMKDGAQTVAKSVLKKSVGLALKVVELTVDPIELGDDSMEPYKKMEVDAVLISGFSSETTLKDLQDSIDKAFKKLQEDENISK